MIDQAARLNEDQADARMCMPLASDLCIAWREARGATREAVQRKLKSPTHGVPALDAWLLATESNDRADGGIRNILSMPKKAQRELARADSASCLFFVSLHSELSSLSPIFFSGGTS